MKKFPNFLLLTFALALFLFASCDDKEDPMVITSIEPLSGDYGDQVTIKGSQLSAGSATPFVKFGSVAAQAVSASSTEVVVKVPLGAATGKITVEASGRKVTSAEEFTITAGKWQKKANFPNSVSPIGSSDPFFTIGSTAYVHVSRRTVNGNPVDAAFWAYNSTNDTWTQKKELSKDFFGSGVPAWGTATKGYVLNYLELWEYDPAADTWTLQNNLPVIFSTTTGNVLHSFYISSVNRAYCILGNGYLMTYDPDTDTWGQQPDLPFASILNSTFYQQNAQGTADKAYFRSAADVWQFDPATGQWTKVADFPSRFDSNYSFRIGNDLYIGSSDEDNLWVYKSSTQAWARKSGNFTPYRNYPLTFSVGDKAYLGMGLNNGQTSYLLTDLYEYIP